MKSIVNKLIILSAILLGYSSINAQLADVTYSVRVGNVFSSEGGVFGPCWETGNEEYTAYGGFFDNTNTSVDLSGCLQCNNNGNCNYGGGTFIGSRSNNAYQLYYYIDAWEDDNGSRCSYNSGDDCRNAGSPGFLYFREITGPSNNVYYTGGPQAGGSSHQIRLDWTWKYSGNANALNPGCSAAYASYSGGAIHSWSANLNAGRTYQFTTLGLSGEDTYIRIYSPDGFTLYASNDDASGTLQSNAVFTPSVSGTYYVEVSRYDRQYLTGGGSLMYQDASTPPVNGGQIGASSTVCSGGGASFSSISDAAGGFDGSLNYQWQSSSNGTSWSNIAGATGSTYAVSNLTSTTYFRRMASDCKNTAGYSNTVTVTVTADPSVTITTSSPNGAICVGGTTALTANISGGTGSYTLQWQYQDNAGNWLNTGSGALSMNASPSQTRDYRILVSNNLGCDAAAVQTVTVVADPVFTITGTDVTCNGLNNGTASAVLSGGLPLNYGYNWSSNDGISSNNNPAGDGTTSVTGLFPAEWVINTTVSPSWGCSATASIVINEPSVLTASSTSGSIACNGGTTTVTVSGNGGTAPYSGTGTFTVGAGTYSYTVTDANGCTSITSITITEPSALVASSTSGSIACNGGTTTVSVSGNGGTAPYSGTGTFTVGAGTYNYTVTDANGCSATTTITVSEPSVLTASSTSGSIACNGGSTTVTVSGNGGTAPYSGTGTFTVVAGTYSYTVTDANGCSATTSITVTEPSVLTASSTSGSIACNGGTTTVTVSGNGGTAPYSGTGTFTVGAGTYNYTVTDANGCSASTSITITEPTALTASISSNAPNATVCSGGTAGLSSSVSGGTGPYSYQWQYQNNSGTWLNTCSTCTNPTQNASPSQTRDYRVIVTDANGCSVIVVQTVTVIADPVFTISGTNVTCNGFNDGTATAVLTGGLPLNYGYNWYSNDGISSNNNPAGDGTTSVTGLFPAEWVINTTVAGPSFGCYASASITITEPTPLTSNAVISDAIDCYGENGEIIVFAAGGTPDYSGIGTFSVSAGDYSYTVTDANGCVSSVDISISQPELLVASSSISDDINCYGETGVISVSAAGGTLDYSGTGDYTVSAGDYSYTVTDANGCSSTTSITITEPSLLTVNAGGDETVFYGYGPMSCASLTAVAEGGTPDYTYIWNSGVGADITVCPTENGEYSVTVTDANGCVATDELWICVVDVTCQAGNSGNMKVEMCQIPPGNPGNAHTICIDASAVPAHLAIGCVLGACGELESACSGVVEVVQASNAAKDAGMSTVLALTAYPNPVAGMTTISVTPADKGNYEIRMIDMTGRTVATIYNGFISDFENITFDMDMTGMSAGVYSVNVVGDNGIADNIKIVKQ